MKSILQVVQELIKPYIDKVAKNIAPVEVSPSEHSYTVGKSLIFKGVMYKVTSAIAVNDELEVGVNIIADTDVSTKKLSTYTADATAWDTAPTENSTKPVTSGGVYQAITSVSIDDMTGATSSADGIHGLVPAPLIADRDKVLKGDGTWSGEIGDEISDIVNVLGAKNLLPNTATSQIVNGVTFTVNSDKSVSCSGTSTARSYIVVYNGDALVDLIGKSIIVSGCPGGGDSVNGYDLNIVFFNNGTEVDRFFDVGEGLEIVVPTHDNARIYIIAEVANINMSNKIFYPMIRLISIKDDTYVPYVSTNKELTDWVLVDPVQSISGSLNGTKPTFYKKGKTLLMTDFPHPAAIGGIVTVTLKPEYKFKNNQSFGVLNYSGWTNNIQVFHVYSLNASNNVLTSSITAEFYYHYLYEPVEFLLL